MLEDDEYSTICKANWSNLPHELLSQIANSLGPFGYLSFCLVCKDWRNATLESSRERKFSRCGPCLLLYGGKSPQCTLLSNTDNIYTIDFPELNGATCLASYDGESPECTLPSNTDNIYTIDIPDLYGATCLASNEGWLLVFCDGSLFFFCPFSKAKLELPNCPFEELTDHIAAFSSPPTSQDCIVVVVNYTSTSSQLHLHMLCRGDSTWVHKVSSPFYRTYFRTTIVAYFLEGELIIMDNHKSVSIDVVSIKQWNAFCFPKEWRKKIVCPRIIWKDVKRKLGLNADVSFSTCGTVLHLQASDKFPIVVFKSEYIRASNAMSHLKGVWVLPRYHHIPAADQSW